MNIEFMPVGGGNEIGANSYYVNIEGAGFILDCGTHPQKRGIESLPDFSLLADKELDYLIVSHAHQDHADSLPYYISRFPYLKILSTPQTKEILERTLHNSVEIMRSEVPEDELKVFSHQEIDLLLSTVGIERCNEPAELFGYKQAGTEPITLTFYDAGHILGSASVLLEHKGKRLFYTGDINLSSQTLTPPATLPEEKVDVLILECTYGATDSSVLRSWEEETSRFIKQLNKVLSRGGSVLVPVFALGKLQELSAIIWKAMLANKLPRVPIYAGGMGMKLNYLYEKHRYTSSLNDTEFQLSKVSYSNLFDVKNNEDLFKTPSIILATSGMMMPRTASYSLAKVFLEHKDSAIFTVGYTDPSTPGYIVSKAKKGDVISLDDGYTEQKVKCDIVSFRFSAHGKREELLEVAERLQPEHIFLVHGDEAAIDRIGAELLKQNKHRKVYRCHPGKVTQVTL